MPGLTIVIPTYEEERKIARDVREAGTFLASNGLSGEVIVSDDGSSDGTVRAAREVTLPSRIQYSVLPAAKHRGKGAAVRSGILSSHGEYVMFADSGMTVPYDNALKGLRLLQEGAAIWRTDHASCPRASSSATRTLDRKILSALFRKMTIHWLHIPSSLTDTQCGFKLYRGDVARRLYASCETDGFLFDIEIILRALNEGLRIREFPVEWSCDRDSRLGLRRKPGDLPGLVRLKSLALRR